MQTFHSQEDFDLIEAYLMGLLESEKQEEVRLKILSDANFAARVSEINELQLGIERAALASRLNSFHSEISDEERKVPVRKLNTFQFWGIAASFFLIITAGTWWLMGQKSPGEDLYQAYYQADPGLVTSMSGEGNYEFDRGMVDFKSGDYVTSLEFWKPLLDQAPENDTLLYFVAINQLQLGELIESKRLLEQVVLEESSEFCRDANWYLGLIEIKEGQYESAISRLKASDRAEAATLISQLQKLDE